MNDLQQRLAARLQEQLAPCDWQGHDLEPNAVLEALQEQGLELIAPSDAPVVGGMLEFIEANAGPLADEEEMSPAEFAVNLILSRDSDLATDFAIHATMASAVLENVTPLSIAHALANACPPVDRWIEMREQLLLEAAKRTGLVEGEEPEADGGPG